MSTAMLLYAYYTYRNRINANTQTVPLSFVARRAIVIINTIIWSLPNAARRAEFTNQFICEHMWEVTRSRRQFAVRFAA